MLTPISVGNKLDLANRLAAKASAESVPDPDKIVDQWLGPPRSDDNIIQAHYTDYFSVIDKTDQAIKTNFLRKVV